MTTYTNYDGDSYHARQAQGVHPEDQPLVGDRHRDDADEIVIQAGVFCVCLFGAGLCGFVLALVSWLIH